jgi:hypothetical protein
MNVGFDRDIGRENLFETIEAALKHARRLVAAP